MEEDVGRPPAEPQEAREAKRNEALVRYDAHPGIAATLLAVMAFLFIVVVYLFASDRIENAAVSGRHVEAVPTKNPLIGLPVLSSDGNKVGTVESVDGEPDGKITAINVTTGGFLGLGPKLVAIPEGRFTRTRAIVRLGMTADEVSKLPEVKDGS